MRIGDEVRWPTGPHSGFAHAVLRELERAGFRGAPRLLGIDEQGRVRLSDLSGLIPPDLAHDEWTDEQLVAAAELARGFHDALAGSPLAACEETVCHNDLGPCNTVHVDGLPAAFIDWDSAAPGPRVADLAHAIWYWAVVSETDALPLEEQVRRARLMCDAYGGAVERISVPAAILATQERVIANIPRTRRQTDADARYWQRALGESGPGLSSTWTHSSGDCAEVVAAGDQSHPIQMSLAQAFALARLAGGAGEDFRFGLSAFLRR